MEKSTTKLNKFYKLMIGDFQERLRIPSAFLKHLSENLSDNAIIEGHSGSCWHVKLNKHSDGLYFEHGWEKFVSQHSLSFGEFLLFTYNGDVKFNVNIFSRSACEREGTHRVYSPQDPIHGKKGHARREGTHRVYSSQDPIHGKKGHARKLRGERKECGRPQSTSPDKEQEFKVVQEKGLQCDTGHAVPLMKRDELVKKNMKAKEAASSFTSQYPYFVTKLKGYNVRKSFGMYIPAPFAKANLPHGSSYMSLQTIDGNSWNVMFQNYDKHRWFTSGWRAFTLDNKLNETDYCAFEFVDGNNVRVHIFRD